MKKTIGKIFGVTFFVVMMLCVTTLFASAETYNYNNINFDVQVEGDFQYILVKKDQLHANEADCDDGAILIKYTGTASSVAIPTILGGEPVFYVYGSSFKDNKAIQTVTIGESVKVIGSNAFENCSGLQTVLVAKNVDRIYANAFKNCTALKSVTFQKGSVLKRIDESVFYNCTSLNNFTIPDAVETIDNFVFWDCNSMTSIVIPDSVTSIGVAVFFHCDSLVEAEIGDGLTRINSWNAASWDNYSNWGTDDSVQGTFEGCISLNSVKFGSALEVIDQDSFAGTAIQNLTIPSHVVTVGTGAYMNCNSLKTVTVSGTGNSTINSSAFQNCASLESIEICDGVTSLGDSALRNCYLLTDVSFGNDLLSIGNHAFRDDNALKTITIPSNVTSLGEAAFYHCDNLETVKTGNGITELRSQVAASWDNYDNWATDDSVQGTFEGCINLKSIEIGSAVKTIHQDCFAGTALVDVVIPDNVITVSHGVFYNCPVLEKITIGNGVTSLGESVLRNCDSLTDVTIGKGVVSIGNYAFRDNDALVSIYIPSNVTTIGVAMFYQCDLLETAVIGNGVTQLNSWNAASWDNYDNWGTDDSVQGTFEGCISLKNVTLGSGLILIGRDSFAGTMIESLTVPGKVSTIESGAFAGATQLKDIYFTGNWAASVGDSIFNNIADGYTVHYIANKIGYDDLAYNKATFVPVTVTFDNNDDDVFAAPTEAQILAPVGGYVIEPINPTAFGYHFDGWYKDAACTEKWDFANDNVTEDTTLYAKWNSVDDVVPLRPENISTESKDGSSITLKWSAVDGATGYNVYVNGVKHNDSTIFTTEYTVTGLDSSTTYEFVVRAVNSKGESPDSLIYADRTNDHVHAYGEWAVTKEATCAEDGEQTRTCECGATEKEAIPATGEHVYGEWIVTAEPTCSEDGSKESACTCGDKQTETIPATGEHTYGEWEIIEEATETSAGARERVCTACGAVDAEEIPMLAPHDHVYGEWVVTAEPTCAEEGTKECECSCGDKKTEVIPATDDHAFGEWEIIEEPTETSVGIREHVCTVCGKATAEEIPMLTSGIKGDVNGDGRVTAADARLVLRAAARVETLSDNAMALAEVTGDGRVTAADARKILRVAAKVDEF